MAAGETACVLPANQADLLGVQEENLGTATVRVLGADYPVVGIVDPERYDRLRDISGDPLTPLDVEVHQPDEQRVGIDRDGLQPAFVHLSSRQVLFLSGDAVARWGEWSRVSSIAVLFENPERGSPGDRRNGPDFRAQPFRPSRRRHLSHQHRRSTRLQRPARCLDPAVDRRPDRLQHHAGKRVRAPARDWDSERHRARPGTCSRALPRRSRGFLPAERGAGIASRIRNRPGRHLPPASRADRQLFLPVGSRYRGGGDGRRPRFGGLPGAHGFADLHARESSAAGPCRDLGEPSWCCRCRFPSTAPKPTASRGFCSNTSGLSTINR